MPTIVQTFQGRVTGLWGSAHMRGKDGKMHLLKMGDMVHQGDVILTTQNGIVQLSPEESATAQAVMARAAQPTTPAQQPDIDRVISALNESDSQAATAAGLNGGDGAGDLTPGLRVDRISEAVTPTGLTRSGISGSALPPLATSGLTTAVEAPRLTITAGSNIIDAIEEGPAVNLGLTAPTGTSTGAVITLTQVPVIGLLQKADGTPVSAGSVLTPAELVGLKYLPPADYNGSDRVGDVDYTVSDGGRSASGSVGIVLAPVDDAPVAAPDAGNTPEDTPVTGNVLSNDHDVDGPALQVTQYSIAGATHAVGTPTSIVGIGTLVVNADGGYSFTPAADYHGPVPTIGYTISDGTLTSSSTLTLAVTAVNDAPEAGDDLASTPINVPVPIAVLANDHDRDGDPLTVTGATLANPAQGTLSVNPDGSLAFTPASNVAGPVTINYTVSDGQGGSDTASVTVNVGANTPPTGADSTHTLAEDGAYTVAVTDFGFADADAGQALANIRIDSLPATGSLLLNGVAVTAGTVVTAADVAAGQLVFVPVADANGAPYASFTFSVQDSAGAFDAAPNTLTFDVTPLNDTPVAANDAGGGNEDTPQTGNVLGNDSDVDGDALSVTQFVVAGSTHAAGTVATLAGVGTLVINADGSYAFTPVANYNGAVPVATYTATDGTANTTATLTLAITPINDAPVAGDDLASTLINTPVTITVLTNDSDVDGDTLTVSNPVLADPTRGSVVVNADGTLSFTPASNVSGPVTISYTVSDGHGGSDTATVTVNVGANTPPTGADSVHTLLEDGSYTVAVTDFGFADADAGQTISNVRIDSLPANGSLLLNGVAVLAGAVISSADVAAGQLVFVPVANANGAPYASFTFSVQDSAGAFDAAPNTLTLNVTPVNDALVATDDAGGGNEDTPQTGNVLGNDTDIDGDALSVTQFSIAGTTYAAGTTATLAGVGTLVINGNGSYSFTPATDYNGPVPIATYTATDGTASTTATLTLGVTPVNDAPVAGDDLASTPINTAVTITVLANDSDVDGDALTVSNPVLIDPTRGSVSVNPDGTLSFTPASNVSGPVTISYTVSDGHGGSDTASVTVNVGNNTPPTGADSTHTLAEDGTYTVAVTDFGFADADAGQSLANVRIDSVPAAGTLLLNGVAVTAGAVVSAAEVAAGHLVFVPAADGNGAPYASFSFSVQDSAGAFDAAPNTLTLNVTPVNDAPVAAVDTSSAPEDTVQSGNVLSNDADVDANTLSVTQFVVGGVSHAAGTTAVLAGVGSLLINANGSYSFTPVADYNGPVPVATYTVTDGSTSVSSTLTLSVTAAADAVNDVVAATEDTPVTFNPITGLNETSGADNFENAGRTLTAVGTPAHGSVSFAADGTITYTPVANYNGPDSFSYTVTSGGVTETATVNLNVAAVNDPPVATVDTSTAAEDTVQTGNVLANDSDADANPLAVTQFVVSGVSHAAGTTAVLAGVGSLLINANGSYTFTPIADYNGPVPVATYTVTDGSASVSSTLTLTVTAAADAVNDVVAATEDTPVTFNPITGLNETSGTDNFENAGRTLTAVGTPAHGTITFTPAGAITYTPTANYSGSDSFTYTVTSGGVTETATITLNVAAVNDAPVNTIAALSTNEDSALKLSGLSINDVDAASGAMTVTLKVASGTLAAVGSGGVSVTGSGSTTVVLTGTQTDINAFLAASTSQPVFTPAANINGSVNLTMTTSDLGNTGSGGTKTDVDTVAITVLAVNDAPVNTIAALSTNEDTALKLSGLKITDVDASTGTMSISLNVATGTIAATGSASVTVAGSGTGTLTLTGTLANLNTYLAAAGSQPTYTPVANANGAVALTMTTSDNGNTGSGGVLTDTDTVNITINAVNDAPVNTIAALSTNEDSALKLSGLSINDVDAASGAMTVTLKVASGTLAAVGSGGVSVTGSGSTTVVLTGTQTDINAFLAASTSQPVFTPAANINGSVNLTMTTSDLGNTGSGGTKTDVDTVAITVLAVNDAPVNTIAALSTNEDTALKLSGLKIADVDASTGTMSISLNVATGTIAATGSASVTVAGSGTGTLTLTGTLANLNTYLATAALQPTYTPVANANGAVALTMTTSDNGNTGSGGALTDTDTVNITINAVNDAPVNTIAALSTNEDSALKLSGLSINDVDAASGAMTVTLKVASGTLAAVGSGGVSVTGSGSTTVVLTGTQTDINAFLAASTSQPVFTPAANASGSVNLTMTTSDLGNTGSGGTKTDVDTVAITVVAVNDAPVNTVPVAQTTNEDTAKVISGVRVADVDSASLSTTLTVAHGTLGVLAGGGATIGGNGSATVTLSGTAAQINAALASITYTPSADFNGSDPLGVSTSDGSLTTSSTVAITVTAVADVVNDVVSATEDTVVTFNPITGLNEVSGADNFENAGRTLTAVGTPAHGTVSFTAAGAITYTPAANYNGPDSFTYTVTSGGVTETATINLNVAAVNDPPVATVDTSTAAEDTVQTGNVLANDSDADANPLTVTQFVVSGVSHAAGTTAVLAGVGSLLINANGSYSFTPIADYNGPVPVATYTVTDGSASVSSTLTLTVTPAADSVNDVVAATEDTPITFNPINGLNETSGADNFENAGRTLTAVGTPAHGSVSFAADGTITYTPVANYNGPDSFSYTVTSGGVTETATINLNVAAVNDAPVLSLDTDHSHNTVSVQAISGLFNTGEDAAGNAIALGTADAHYALISKPAGSAAANTAVDLGFAWVPNDANSTWIGSIAQEVTGVYQYQTSFTLQPGADPRSVHIDFDLFSDNNLRDILINGVSTGISSNIQYATATHIDLFGSSAAFQSGSNTITFVVDNRDPGSPGSSGPTGLRIDNMAGTVGVIEPSGGTHVNDYATIYVEGSPVAIADTDTTITDVDNTTLQSATITLTNAQANDLLQAGALPAGITASVDASGTVVTLSGSATLAAYQTAIQAVQFTNSGNNPSDTVDRIVTVVVNDGSSNSNVQTTTIHVVPVNAAPTLDLDGDNSSAAGTGYAGSVVENAGAVRIVDADIAIADSDSGTLRSASIAITNLQAGDVLNVGALPVGISAAVYDPASGVLTLSGAASLADYQTALAGITFSNSGDGLGAATRIIEVSVNDGSANSNIAVSRITIVPVNDAPAGTDGTALATEDTGYVLHRADFGFTDPVDAPNANNFAAVTVNPTSAGTLTLNGVILTASTTVGVTDLDAGKLVFSAAANATGSGYATLQFNVQDDGGIANGGSDTDSSANTLTINVAAVNDAPVAVADTATAAEAGGVANGTAGVDPVGNVLANDTDADTGDTKTVSAVSGAAAGTVGGSTAGAYGALILNADGSYTYHVDNSSAAVQALRDAADTLTDTFTYTVRDAAGTSSSTTLTVTILGANDAAVITPAVANLTETNAVLSTGGTLAISDVDSPATFVAQSNVAGSNGYGSFTLGANGAWTYTTNTAHNEFVAGTTYTDSLTVTSADGTTSTIAVNILGTNDAAVITPAVANLTETNAVLSTGGTLTISDVDSPATFVAQSNVAGSNGYGSFTLGTNGVWTYAANTAHNEFAAGTTYTDSLTVTSADGTTSTITVNILGTNDAALITPAVANLTETNAVLSTGGTLSISDVDSSATFVAQSNVAGSNGFGHFTLAANGAWTYATDTAHNEFAAGTTYTDSLTVTSADGTASTITVNILGTNDAPVASNDVGGVLAGSTLTLTAANGVILSGSVPAGRDSDVDTGDTLSVINAVVGAGAPSTAVTAAGTAFAGTYGDLVLKSDGSYTYSATRADAIATGSTVNEVFTYQVSDGHGGASNATLTISVGGQADTVTAVAPTTTALTSTLGLSGEYYGYNDYNPTGSDANRRHSDDGTVGNLDHVADFNTLVNARNATMGGSASILGTTTAAAANTADATFLARNIDYGGSPSVTSSLGTNVNVAAGGSIAGLTDANSQLYRFLDRTAGSDASTLVVHQGTADNDAAGAGATSGLGNTSDAGIRLDGEVYMAAGVYDIRVTGDDGYRLKLGGNVVAMVDDIQSPTAHVYTGIGVAGGMTALELLYWEQGGNAQLKVEYKLNGAADTTYQVLGTNTLPMFNDANTPTLADNQHLIAGSTTGSWLVESGSVLNGAVGNDTLTGNTGSDKLNGGVGNDVLSGAVGDDVLVGGKGNDTLTGGVGHDVFRWELADGGTPGTPARDTITDFNNANYSGDVLDLRDLLVGENHAFNTITGASTTAGNSGTNALTTVADAGNLGNYLHFSTSGGNTVLEISSTGGFSSGYSSSAVDQVITITGVNLVAGLGNDGAIIADLFKRGKLVTDGH